MYKMVDISAETWNKAEVSVIKAHENDNVNKTILLLLCISDIKKIGVVKNLYNLIEKEIKGKYGLKTWVILQIRRYKIDKAKLIKGSKLSMYVHKDNLISIIMQSRLSDQKTIKFRADLEFNQVNLILKKEQSLVILLLKAFSAKKKEIKLQHKALKNERVRTDMYFSEHKFAVENHEKGHTDRNQDKENERQIKIGKHSDCKFFYRINRDAEGFDIFL